MLPASSGSKPSAGPAGRRTWSSLAAAPGPGWLNEEPGRHPPFAGLTDPGRYGPARQLRYGQKMKVKLRAYADAGTRACLLRRPTAEPATTAGLLGVGKGRAEYRAASSAIVPGPGWTGRVARMHVENPALGITLIRVQAGPTAWKSRRFEIRDARKFRLSVMDESGAATEQYSGRPTKTETEEDGDLTTRTGDGGDAQRNHPRRR